MLACYLLIGTDCKGKIKLTVIHFVVKWRYTHFHQITTLDAKQRLRDRMMEVAVVVVEVVVSSGCLLHII